MPHANKQEIQCRISSPAHNVGAVVQPYTIHTTPHALMEDFHAAAVGFRAIHEACTVRRDAVGHNAQRQTFARSRTYTCSHATDLTLFHRERRHQHLEEGEGGARKCILAPCILPTPRKTAPHICHKNAGAGTSVESEAQSAPTSLDRIG